MSDSFRYIAHWQADVPDEGEAVLAFWKREGAIEDEQLARGRLKEIVMHARDSDNEVAGVCTVIPKTLPLLGQPMYYYRCFIATKWRSSRLILFLFQHAFELLESHAKRDGYPCIGVLTELQHMKFDQMGRVPVWPGAELVYIGRSQQGFEVRVRYFRGAKLKSPAKA